MTPGKLRPALPLSLILLVLAAAAALGGLLLPGLYRDNALVTAGWRGNDLVTLLLAVPALAAALRLGARGSLRAQLVWLGLLDYLLYNTLFYLFGAAFNAFFLLYAAQAALAIFALVYGAAALDAQAVADRFAARTPARWIAGFMAFIALGLATVYVLQSAGFILTGQLPPVIAATGHVTNVVFALDLTLVVPAMLLGAVWLWQGRPWGYVLAGVTLVKGAVYMPALTATTLSAYLAGALAEPGEAWLWAALGAGCLLAAAALLANAGAEAKQARMRGAALSR
jgi:hypothetical protein